MLSAVVISGRTVVGEDLALSTGAGKQVENLLSSDCLRSEVQGFGTRSVGAICCIGAELVRRRPEL